MTWPRHLLVRVQGDFVDTALAPLEQWSFGVRIAALEMIDGVEIASALDPLVLEADAVSYLTDTVAPAVAAFISSGLISRYVVVEKISANIMVHDTSSGSVGSAVYEYDTPNEVFPGVTAGVAAIAGGGGSGDFGHGTQSALVVTTRTDSSRGFARRGRFYLPGPIGLLTDWVLSTANRNSYAGNAQTFLTALRDTAPGPSLIGPAVVSPSGAGGAGTLRSITGVAVGRVLDTQQRRRNRMDEDYLELPIPSA